MTRALLLFALLLAGCSNEPEDICGAALEGVDDANYQLHVQCRHDVYVAMHNGGQSAAQKYRDLPRSIK